MVLCPLCPDVPFTITTCGTRLRYAQKRPDEKAQSKHKTIKEYETWIAENIRSKQCPQVHDYEWSKTKNQAPFLHTGFVHV